MTKNLCFLLLTVLFSFQLRAQSVVTGQLKFANGNAVTGASVMLFDSSKKLIKTDITDVAGKYTIEQVMPGKYLVTASFVGYEKISSPEFTIAESQDITLKELTLKAIEKKLQAITVKSSYQKPMFEVKADKTVFNVENSINATGSNALELLQKSPGVSIDKDDNISMKGKNGVRIYIDGRASQISNADLAVYLRSVNSVDIESIELISNPSARYDAAGNAGIINIKFKKNKKAGLNGSVSAGLNFGKTVKTTNAFSLNYRDKKINFFSNYSNNWGDRENEFYIYRQQGDTIYDQANKQVTSGWVHNIKAGADIFLNKNSTIGFIGTANLNYTTSNTSSRTPISSMSTDSIDRILIAQNTIPGDVKNMNFNVNYRYVDTLGHALDIDADHGIFKSRKTSYQPNYYKTPYPETFWYENIYSNSTPTDVNINTIKLDYETGLRKGKLGLGGKYSDVETDNTFDYYSITNGYAVKDLSVSTSFTYKENINALYINYNRPVNTTWIIQGGLRMENTKSTSTLLRADGTSKPDDVAERNYTDWFPSAAVTYNANQNHSLTLNYSRRIDRPSYQDLNPFENKLDELTYQKGNAFLRPQYTDNIELTHTFKYRYTTAISYSHVKDFMAQIIDTSGNSRYLTPKNMDATIFNINFSIPVQLAKWWNMYANINVYHSHYTGNFNNGKTIIDLPVTSGNFYMQQTFALGDGYTAELSGFYNAPSVWAGSFNSDAMDGMDIGIQKTLFKGNGNVKFTYTDLLKTMKWRGSSNYNGAYIEAHGNWESQQLRMNLTWRFGNKQVKQMPQRKTGSEEENKRTQSSGGLGGS